MASEPPADPVVGRSILGFVDVLAVMVVAVIIAIRHEGHRTTSNAPAVASPATDCRTVLLRPARRGVNRQSRRIPRSSLRGRWSLATAEQLAASITFLLSDDGGEHQRRHSGLRWWLVRPVAPPTISGIRT